MPQHLGRYIVIAAVLFGILAFYYLLPSINCTQSDASFSSFYVQKGLSWNWFVGAAIGVGVIFLTSTFISWIRTMWVWILLCTALGYGTACLGHFYPDSIHKAAASDQSFCVSGTKTPFHVLPASRFAEEV